MIKHESVLQAVKLANNLRDKEIAVEVSPDSPLMPLTNASYPVEIDMRDGNGNMMINEFNIIETSKRRNALGVSDHDVVMEETVSVVAETVNDNLKLAQQVINPIIAETIESVNSSVVDLEKAQSQVIAVVPYFYLDVWSNPIFVGMVERFADMPANGFDSMGKLPQLTAEELGEYVTLGVERLDEDVKDVIANMSEDALYNAYEYGIRNASVQDNVILGQDNLKQLIRDPMGNRNKILLTFIIATGLKGRPPEGVAMDLALYNEQVTAIIAAAGRACGKVIDKRENNVQRKVLDIKYPYFNVLDPEYSDRVGEISVNGEVYLKWLEEGGSPEALFGSNVSTRLRGYDELLENAEGFKDRWVRASRLVKSNTKFKRFNNIIESLSVNVARQINALPDDHPILKESMHIKLKEEVSKLNSKKTENLNALVQKLVCCVMFDHTEAYRILTAIDSAMGLDETLTPREAALLATIELVSDWTASLIEFK